MLDIPDSFEKRIRRKVVNGVVHFSLVDIMAEFSDTKHARRMWSDTKKRLAEQGFQLYGKIVQLKLPSTDGKSYKTDAADFQTCLRVIQAMPSAQAEGLREWMAQVSAERVEELADPELGEQRARERTIATYQKRGMDDQWINSRLREIDDRNQFTNALKRHVQNIADNPAVYGIATNKVYQGLWQRTAGQLKQQMGLSGKDNLRDHQPAIAAHYTSIVELTVSTILDKEQTVTPDKAIRIIETVAAQVGASAADLASLLGIDLATGSPLLRQSS